MKEEMKKTIKELGFFPAIAYWIVLTAAFIICLPLIILECLIDLLCIFNDWTKTWVDDEKGVKE